MPSMRDAKALPNTGGLFVERQVGRGRIVVSAMQLSERDLINWRSGFESLFNALPAAAAAAQVSARLLRRRDARLGRREVERPPARCRAQHEAALFRPRSGRRDGVPLRGRSGRLGSISAIRPAAANRRRCANIGRRNTRAASARGTISAPRPNAARGALREAAGVEVPGADFVVLCLAAYLVALVPLNWLVFHTMGRVEWAWIAAPIIAIVGTWVIVQRAQLDIGFVRAQTEIGILEQQPDHPRAHLSRYTALYTSLSTTYDFEFDKSDDADRAVSQRRQLQIAQRAKASPA